MAENKYWKFDNLEEVESHTITATDSAIKNDETMKLFKFTVKRLKDVNTKREQLEISAEVEDEPAGTITTDLVNLENDLTKFRMYGVVLARPKYVELCKVINDNYYFIKKKMTETIDYTVTDNVVSKVIAMVREYIQENEIVARKVKGVDLYCIPVPQFSELMSQQYRHYSKLEVKEALYNGGYIQANKGSYDYVVNVDGDRLKTVSFFKDKIDPSEESGHGE